MLFFLFQVNWGMWGLPKIVCDFYIALDVICSTSSIFNLVAISFDRYIHSTLSKSASAVARFLVRPQ